MAPESMWLIVAFATTLLTVIWWEQHRRRSASHPQTVSATNAGRQARALEAWKTYFFQAEAREHRRITGELHDGVAQNLAGIALLVRSLETRLREAGGDESLVEDATRIAALLQETSERAQARLLAAPGSRVSKNAAPDPRNLARELADLAQGLEIRFMIPCAYSGPNSLSLPGDTAEQLREIARIALSTALQETESEPLKLTLRPGAPGQDLVMAVECEGWDFGTAIHSPEVPMSRSQRLMALRAERLGGSLKTSERLPRGTRLECRIPTSS